MLRRRVLEAVELVLEEELTEALGTARYERGAGRRGYRHGAQSRRITTALGAQELQVPRGRVLAPDGSSQEFRSEVVPRYARRTREVDEAILGAYLAGANTRRIRKALSSLLGEEHLSKSAVSWVATRLKAFFAAFRDQLVGSEAAPKVHEKRDRSAAPASPSSRGGDPLPLDASASIRQSRPSCCSPASPNSPS